MDVFQIMSASRNKAGGRALSEASAGKTAVVAEKGMTPPGKDGFAGLAKAAREASNAFPSRQDTLPDRHPVPGHGDALSEASGDLDAKLEKVLRRLEGVMGKLVPVAPGKSSDEASVVRAVQTRNLSNLEKALEAFEAKISSSTGKDDNGALLENMKTEALPEVIGGLLAKFDAENETRFLENFTRSVEALNAELETLESDAEKIALLEKMFGTGGGLASDLAAMMGVERPLGGDSAKPAPFTRFASLRADDDPRSTAGMKSERAHVIPEPRPPEMTPPKPQSATPIKDFPHIQLAMAPEDPAPRSRTSPAPLTMPGLEQPKSTDETGILKFLERIGAAGKAGRDLMSPAASSDVTTPRSAETLANRTDILNSLGSTASGGSVSQEDFESLLQKASQARSPEASSASASSAQASRFSGMIANQLRNAQFTQNRMKVELAPRGLGELEIDVETDAAGKMRATIRAENPMVLDMLRSDKSQLHELLQSKGFELSSDDLEFSERDSEGSTGGEGQPGDATEEAGIPSEDDADDARQMISTTNVDIRI
ncbi:flagellar hook-length control protein FliK [Salipiger mucosus]|uniref:Flagellar hook-length control protein-like C-terminal domain-containing protein n=1 Tax=Salipiger mucosus DSM 16094 TaxID=1123237 RepID=S9QDR2_9RHOB|nr:flagellar hook-length control protein FliK [Salipiger mucosus]EPX78047.1 hypothetical protein Salmuc_03369 [Salipiger mucosus DSM 16094]